MTVLRFAPVDWCRSSGVSPEALRFHHAVIAGCRCNVSLVFVAGFEQRIGFALQAPVGCSPCLVKQSQAAESRSMFGAVTTGACNDRIDVPEPPSVTSSASSAKTTAQGQPGERRTPARRPLSHVGFPETYAWPLGGQNTTPPGPTSTVTCSTCRTESTGHNRR